MAAGDTFLYHAADTETFHLPADGKEGEGKIWLVSKHLRVSFGSVCNSITLMWQEGKGKLLNLYL